MPNYKLASKKAYKCLILYAPPTIPIDIFAVIKNSPKKIKIMSFKKWKEKLQRATGIEIVGEMKEIFGSEFGKTIYDTQKDCYLIIYNDKKCFKTQRWTIAHELGHIFLEHLENEEYFLGNKNNNEQENEKIEIKLEHEANTFAKHLLVPFPLIKYLFKTLKRNEIFTFNIEEIFEIGPEASQNIITHLNKLYYWPSDIELENKFVTPLKYIPKN